MIISALFIDFDNVLVQLRDHDPATAARFCNRPINWLNALAEAGGEQRRLVTRRCYASPHLISAYRRNFTHGGIEVVDTPPLTQRSKNGADILMVMDIMDSVARHPHIEEYVILSGDADFVPVLHRLRRENKQTTVFAPANIAGAYRNSADRTIDVDFFVDSLKVAELPRRMADDAGGELPRIVLDLGREPGAELSADVGAAIETILAPMSQRRLGQVTFPAVGIALRRDMGQLIGDNWAGFGTMTRFLQAVPFDRFKLDLAHQCLVEDDFRLTLDDWGDEADEAMRDFATDVFRASDLKVPLMPPSCYSFVFDRVAAAHRDSAETFAEAVERVLAEAQRQGVGITNPFVRTIGNGFLAQEHPLGPDSTPSLLASLWRQQVFDLAGQPDWLENEVDAELLARWFHASDEDLGEATAEFLQVISHDDTELADDQEPAFPTT